MHRPPRWSSGKASAWREGDLGSIPAFAVDFVSTSNHTSDFKIGTPVVTLPGAWHYWVSAGTDCPGVRMERESLIAVWQHVQQCRSVTPTHKHVAGTLRNQQTKTPCIARRSTNVLQIHSFFSPVNTLLRLFYACLPYATGWTSVLTGTRFLASPFPCGTSIHELSPDLQRRESERVMRKDNSK